MKIYLSHFCLLIFILSCKSASTISEIESSDNLQTQKKFPQMNTSHSDFPYTGFVSDLKSECNQAIIERWESARYIRVGSFAALVPTNHAQLPPLKKISILQNVIPIKIESDSYEEACKNDSLTESLFPLSIEGIDTKDQIQLKKEKLSPSLSGAFEIELEQIFSISGSELKINAVFEQSNSQLTIKITGDGLHKIRLRAGTYQDSHLNVQQNSNSFEIFSPNSFWTANFISPASDIRFQRENYFYFSAINKEILSLELNLKFSPIQKENHKDSASSFKDSEENGNVLWWTEPHSGIQIALPKDTFDTMESKLKVMSEEKKSLSIAASLKELLEQNDPNFSIEKVICPHKFLPYTSFEAMIAILNPRKWGQLKECEKFIPHFDLSSFIE